MRKNIFSSRLLFHVLAVICASVLVFSVVYTSARYLSAKTYSDNAKVAKFSDLSLDKTVSYYMDLHALLQPGCDIDASYTVNFGPAEVATAIFMVVDIVGFTTEDDYNMVSDIPLIGDKFNWSISESWEYQFNDGASMVYCALLNPGDVFSRSLIKDNIIHFDKTIRRTDTDLLTTNTITFTFHAVQIGGFSSIEEAYEAAF